MITLIPDGVYLHRGKGPFECLPGLLFSADKKAECFQICAPSHLNQRQHISDITRVNSLKTGIAYDILLFGALAGTKLIETHSRSLFLPCLSLVVDNELCGSAGGPGVCAGQGAVQGAQPCDPVWMYRRHCGAAA